MNIKDILKIQGFKGSDIVGFGIKNIYSEKEWSLKYSTVDSIIEKLSNQQEGCNYYISNAIHLGGKAKGEKTFCEDNYPDVVEMVIDIDYGPHHKKESIYDTFEEALHASKKLPSPTMVIHSGGGLQVHYRLKERLSIPIDRRRLKSLTEDLQHHVGADSCHAIGHVFRLAGTQNFKPGAPARKVEILNINGKVEYSLKELEQWCIDNSIPKKTSCIKVKQAKRGKPLRTRKRIKSATKDRSYMAYAFIEDLLKKFPDFEDRRILAVMKKRQFFDHYSEKGEKADNYARADIRRIKRKLSKDKRPAPPNEVKKLKYEETISDKLTATRRKFDQKIFDSNTKRIDISLSLMEHLYLKNEQSILSFPCASGKTTAAIMLAATYASPENRMWIVTQKISDTKDIAEKLRTLGCNAVEWHGRPADCPVPWDTFMPEKRGHFCYSCPKTCTAKAKYLSKDKSDCEEYDVLVTTHSHWQATVNNENFKDSVKFVIVDESPTTMEYFTLTDADKEIIKSVLKHDKTLVCDFESDCFNISRRCSDGGCYRVPPFNSIRKSKEINQCIHKLFSEEKISPEVFELVKSFINFFSATEIYAMTEVRDGEYKMTFIRGKVDLRTTVPHIVLDGSALMNDVNWEGFTIYECDELKQKYPNTTVDILDGNPSKNFLSQKENFEDLLNMVISSIEKHPSVLENKSPVVVFRNKELGNNKELEDNIGQLHAKIEEMGLTLIDMSRGEHIGSNKAKDAELCAVAMSLFNPLSYYVLRTALVSHNEISPERIWKRVFNTPHMKRNGGFADYLVQQTYCRSVVVDLYQTIMRGCVRMNPEADYNVICTISGLDVISILQEELSGAKFNFEGAEIVEAIINGESDASIIKKLGITQAKLNKIEESLSLS